MGAWLLVLSMMRAPGAPDLFVGFGWDGFSFYPITTGVCVDYFQDVAQARGKDPGGYLDGWHTLTISVKPCP